MTMSMPEGYTPVTPYLVIDGVAKAIDFYVRAFGAEEIMRLQVPEAETIMHAEIAINGARIMMTDADPKMGTTDPKALGGTTSWLFVYVADVDAAFRQAVDAGATEKMAPTDMFWGDRMASLSDPFGHGWNLATHIADPTPEEIQAGFEAMLAGGECGPGADEGR